MPLDIGYDASTCKRRRQKDDSGCRIVTWTTPSRRMTCPQQSRSPKDYLDLAKSPSATEQQLRTLADSPYSFVVEAVARHPATPGDVLERLLPSRAETWNEQSLLLALAEHPASSGAVLSSIARQVPQLLHERNAQPGFAAGIALFRRPDTPDELLLELLDHPDATTEFRKVAARETAHERVLDRLRQDRSERVRRAAGRPADGV
jgi:hypothetical protein